MHLAFNTHTGPGERESEKEIGSGEMGGGGKAWLVVGRVKHRGVEGLF